MLYSFVITRLTLTAASGGIITTAIYNALQECSIYEVQQSTILSNPCICYQMSVFEYEQEVKTHFSDFYYKVDGLPK